MLTCPDLRGVMALFESRMQALLASLATHVDAWALEEPRELLDAGEWGVAFEALCDNLYEKAIPVFPGEVAEIESLGEGMKIQRRAWRLMHELRVE